MGVLTVIFLGCAALLAASSPAERNLNQAEVADLENRILRILEAGDNKEPPQEQQQEPGPVDHITLDTAVDGVKPQQDVSERVEDIVTRGNTGTERDQKREKLVDQLRNSLQILEVDEKEQQQEQQEDFPEGSRDITSLGNIGNTAVDDTKQQQDVRERVEDIASRGNTGREGGDHDIRDQTDDAVVKKQGCEGHQKGDRWGAPDHDNCICDAPDRLCYHVDCLPGSKIAQDSNDLWACEVVSSKRDITGSAVEVHHGEKRLAITAAITFGLGVVKAVTGIVANIRKAQGSGDQIRELDRMVRELTQMVSNLQLGQEYLRQAILYGRDEMRLKNLLDTHAEMEISDGQYVLPGHNIQAWADSVLSHGSDGVGQVLYNLLEMMKPQSGIFGGKSLFDIYKERLINDKNRFEKLNQKAAQIYGLIGGGYAVWIAALRIKGRTSDIPAKTEDMERELATVGTSLQKYIETSCQDGNGAFYRGTVSVTDTGKPCQRWDSQTPHEHSRAPAKFPSSGLDKNYCRNPDGSSGVWCYTTYPGTRWEYCDVPACNEETCQKGNGASYRGTVSVTESGKTCQRWDRQTPHEHSRTPDNFQSSQLLKNYCRNPDGSSGLWCYTMDPSTRWGYCDVPACAEPCQKGDGSSYRGTVSVTESGKTCQRWDSQTPHGHKYTPDENPSAGLLKNYCRNLDGTGVWCYTTDPSTRWEYCDVPRC